MWEGKSKLTESEQKLPYASFYDYETPAPDPALYQEVAQAMDPAKALAIEHINDLLNPGYLEAERGWCVLPNGCGYVAAHCIMPQVTPEMFEWWFAWHALEDMRYRIWWPWQHYGIYVKDEARKIITDPNTSLTEKYEGITHYVVEDIGTGCNELAISFKRPEELGFDMSRFKKPNIAALAGANVLIYEPGKSMGNPAGCNTMCHTVRELDGGGIEVRTRFWFGYQMIDKKPVKILPDGVRMDETFPRGLAHHAIDEYTRLSYLLPKIYERLGKEPF